MKRFEQVARYCWPHRWSLGIFAVLVLVASTFLVAISLHLGPPVRFLGTLPLSVGIMLWLAGCNALWFHPDRGYLRKRPRAHVVVRACLSGVRGYAAFCLLLVALIAMGLPVFFAFGDHNAQQGIQRAAEVSAESRH